MYLLDTVVISALRRPERHAPVAHWLKAQAPQTLYISVVTVGENHVRRLRGQRRGTTGICPAA